jgi:hypothetical protein
MKTENLSNPWWEQWTRERLWCSYPYFS